MGTRLCFLLGALINAVVAATAFAQSEHTSAALLVAEGVVAVDDRPVDGRSLPSVLPENAVLRTDGGRAAVALRRGGWLFLDAGASVRVLRNPTDNSDRIEVLAGAAIVASSASTPLVDCEREIRLSAGGMFRFDVRRTGAGDEGSCQVRVYDGGAAVRLISVTAALRAGEAMAVNRRCGDMIPTTEFPPNELDEFDRWARASNERLQK